MSSEQDLLDRIKSVCRQADVKVITPTAGQLRQPDAVDVVCMWNYETPAGTPFTVTRTKRR